MKPRRDFATLAPIAQNFARALWGLDLSVHALPSAQNQALAARPRFHGSELWLPPAPLWGVPGTLASYRLAAAAHVSAHLRFGERRYLVKSLKPLQIAIISVLEDARVEHLARDIYPGLFRLWAPYHTARADSAKTSRALLSRLAHALHDEAYVDDDAWVSKGRTLFFEQRAVFHDAELSRHLGSLLGNDLGQMRVQFTAKDYLVEPAYRDDNIGLWQLEQESAPDGSELESEGVRSARDRERSPDRERSEPEEASRIAEPEPSPGGSVTPRPAAAVASEVAARYPEWDYVIRRERPLFCSVRESVPPVGDRAGLDALLLRYTPLRRRLQRAARRLSGRRWRLERRLSDGDRLDLPAAIATVAARARAIGPDPRIYRRVRFQLEPPALLVLVDLSESLNVPARGGAVLPVELARQASTLLAGTLADLESDWAIHGFSSNGRHDVGYYRFKDFDQQYDDGARARLAGMRAHSSTRLGTALRHAGQMLAARAARRRLLLVVTDGEPCDVDSHDPHYLVFDAKQATVSNQRAGITSFCVGLDANAEGTVKRIFGSANFLLLDQMERLPQKLAELWVRLAG